jgi:hypothetical protein
MDNPYDYVRNVLQINFLLESAITSSNLGQVLCYLIILISIYLIARNISSIFKIFIAHNVIFELNQHSKNT